MAAARRVRWRPEEIATASTIDVATQARRGVLNVHDAASFFTRLSARRSVPRGLCDAESDERHNPCHRPHEVLSLDAGARHRKELRAPAEHVVPIGSQRSSSQASLVTSCSDRRCLNRAALWIARASATNGRSINPSGSASTSTRSRPRRLGSAQWRRSPLAWVKNSGSAGAKKGQ